MCGSTYFEDKSLHKYSRMTRGQNGVDVMSMIDPVLVKKDMMHYALDMRAVEEWDEASQIFIVLCKVRLGVAWIKGREVVTQSRRVRHEKMRKKQYIEGYGRCLKSKSRMG